MNRPLLSVCLITYNHVNYIKQAIESVLMQKTSFDYELIIADDCSTDGTTEIIKKYAEKHPKIIRTIIHEKNVGPGENYVTLLEAARGKYIAYLEGDDYWIENTKLEQQVVFLEQNPDYALCCHDIYNLIDGKRKRASVLDVPVTTDLNYLLSHSGYISSLSVVYRNGSHIITMLKKLLDCPMGDYVTYVAVARQGLIKFFPKRMGVYRVHSSGTWSTIGFKKVFEKTLMSYRKLFAELPKEQGEMLKVRYLLILETYFLQDEFILKDEEFKKLLITEMDIKPYVISYIKQNCEERKKISHYISRVPFHLLYKSSLHKLINRIR
jgi:glycosyltransferase involved in cell wall biosynthesis